MLSNDKNNQFNEHKTSPTALESPLAPIGADNTVASTLRSDATVASTPDVASSLSHDLTYRQHRRLTSKKRRQVTNLAMTPAIDSNSNLAMTTATDINHDNDHDQIDHGMTTIVGLITDVHSSPPPSKQGHLGQDYTLDYQILLQLLQGVSPHAARPGSCVEMS